MKILNKVAIAVSELATIAIGVAIIDFTIKSMIPEETRECGKNKIKSFVKKTAEKAINVTE